MADFTVPSKRRRALADMLAGINPPQAQMIGNQLVYNTKAGALSALAKGIGGFMQGRDEAAQERQEKERLDARANELSKYLMPGQEARPESIQFSGGAPELSGLAASGLPSPVPAQEARPASFDYRSAIASALQRNDLESAQQYASMGKLFQDDSAEYFAPDNYFDPKTGKVFGGQASKSGQIRRLPFPIYKAPSSSYDPVSGALIQTGGLPMDMVEGYQSPAAGTAPAAGPGNSRVIPLNPEGKETPQARKLRMDEERQAREDARREREMQIKEREAGAKQAEQDKKVKGAQVNFEMGNRMLDEMEQLIRSTPQGVLLNPTSRENAKAKSLATQLGDIYRSKEFADLGVINPADVPRIEAVVADPTSLRGAAQGKDSQLERIQQMRQMLQSRRSILFGEQPSAPARPRPRLRYE